MTQSPETEVFSQDNMKTYNLVEIVKGPPTTMLEKGPDNTVFSFPVVALIELLLALGLSLVLLFMSLARNAPLEEFANPNTTTDPAKAPWYFMGLQEMLEHGHPSLMAVIFPTIIVLFVLSIPYLDHSKEGTGRWFTSERGKKITLYTTLYAILVMPAFILLDNTFPPRELLRGVLPDIIPQIMIPFLVMLIIVLLPMLILRRYKPTIREIVLMLFTLLFISAIVFTLTGFFFRGPGFELYFPWNMPDGYSPFDNL